MTIKTKLRAAVNCLRTGISKSSISKYIRSIKMKRFKRDLKSYLTNIKSKIYV